MPYHWTIPARGFSYQIARRLSTQIDKIPIDKRLGARIADRSFSRLSEPRLPPQVSDSTGHLAHFRT